MSVNFNSSNSEQTRFYLEKLSQLEQQALSLKQILESAAEPSTALSPCIAKVDRLRINIHQTLETVDHLGSFDPQHMQTRFKTYNDELTELNNEVVELTDQAVRNPEGAAIPPSTAPTAFGPDLVEELHAFTAVALSVPDGYERLMDLARLTMGQREDLLN